MHTRTPAESAALSIFIDSATNDTDLGYPHGAAFLPWQAIPQTDRILWRYLREGRAAVVVGAEDFDMLIEPIQTGRVARLRNELLQRIAVEISFRHRTIRRPPTSLQFEPISAAMPCSVEHPQRPPLAVPTRDSGAGCGMNSANRLGKPISAPPT